MDRLWGIDEIYEEANNAQAEFVLYGYASDETPLIALKYASEKQDAKRILVYGGADGSELATAPLCLELAEIWKNKGYEVWAVPFADPARGRWNEASLQTDLPAQIALATIHKAHGPGETADSNLPINRDGFWQPTEDHPEVAIPSSKENVAFWRLLEHAQPDWIMSLREHLTGGAAVACSQGVMAEDVEACMQRVKDILPLHAGAKLLQGRQVAGKSNFVSLTTLAEEREKAKVEENSLLVGGIDFWQWCEDQSISWQLWLPRWSYTDVAEENNLTSQSRNIELFGEQREDAAERLIPIQITKLNKPGHPAHGKELRVVELKRTESAEVGVREHQQALSGWLAVEAWYERQDILGRTKDIMTAVRDHTGSRNYDRSIQTLRWALGKEEQLLKSYLQNKKYGKPATLAEELHWSVAYRLETCSLVAESFSALSKEDQRDAVIEESVNKLNDILEEHYPEKNLQFWSIEKRKQWLLQWSDWAESTWNNGALEKAKNVDRLERARRELGIAKKEVRDAKNLKQYSEQEKKQEKVNSLNELIKKLVESIEGVKTSETPSVTAKPKKQKPQTKKEQLPTRIQLTSVLKKKLEENGIAEVLIRRFEEKKVPVTILEELEIDWKKEWEFSKSRSFQSGKNKPDHSPKENKQPVEKVKPALKQDISTESSIQSEAKQPVAEAVDSEPQIPERAAAKAEEVVELHPVREEPEETKEPDNGRVPMTEEIKERLKAEGLPPVIIQRLETEGVPRALVEHFESSETEEDSYESKPKPAPKKSEPVAQDEFEVLLPEQLILPPEWGRGPIQWNKQLPEVYEKPFEGLVDQLMQGDTIPAAPKLTELKSTKKQEPTTKVIQATVTKDVVFLKKRVELRAFSARIKPQLSFPKPTGGYFFLYTRKI